MGLVIPLIQSEDIFICLPGDIKWNDRPAIKFLQKQNSFPRLILGKGQHNHCNIRAQVE